MIQTRKSSERGHANHGWLDTYHTFSFADYYDPQFMGFQSLRVINQDRVAPGAGFGTHAHRDMEILTWVLEGALAHRDSLGTEGVIRPGDAQRMSAGTGVRHSEMNASEKEPVHFLQIWILPEKPGIDPGYEQKHFDAEERRGRLRLIASPQSTDGSVKLHQDVFVYNALLDGHTVTHRFAKGRSGWIHVARGEAQVNGSRLAGGDGAAIVDEGTISITGTGEIMLFDLS